MIKTIVKVVLKKPISEIGAKDGLNEALTELAYVFRIEDHHR